MRLYTVYENKTDKLLLLDEPLDVCLDFLKIKLDVFQHYFSFSNTNKPRKYHITRIDYLPDGYVSVKEFRELAGVTDSRVRDYIKRGKIPHIREDGIFVDKRYINVFRKEKAES